MQVREPRALEDTAQYPVLPPGQAEAGKTQGNKDAPVARGTWAMQISAPRPWSIQAPADWELQ